MAGQTAGEVLPGVGQAGEGGQDGRAGAAHHPRDGGRAACHQQVGVGVGVGADVGVGAEAETWAGPYISQAGQHQQATQHPDKLSEHAPFCAACCGAITA